MLCLAAKVRKATGKKVKNLRDKGVLPAVLYGPKLKSLSLEVGLKEFEEVFKETGESSLISLGVEGKKFKVLVHDLAFDSVAGRPIHVDFYQPALEEKIQVKIPLVFSGEAEAVKKLGGTLVKNISEVQVRALPENLPKEIMVNVEHLQSFNDAVLVQDLKVSAGVEILKEPKEIVAKMVPLEKVEEELAKPIEEKVEEVERVEKKKEEEVGKTEPQAPAK